MKVKAILDRFGGGGGAMPARQDGRVARAWPRSGLSGHTQSLARRFAGALPR